MIESILTALEGVKRAGTGYVARCPAHADRSPSLSIREGDDGRVLMHCHAGCATGDVAASLGLTLADLMADKATKVVRSVVKTTTAPRRGLSQWGQQLWRECLPLSGVAVDYLQSRRCKLPPLHGDLRWHPSVKHSDAYSGPALVALVTDQHTNEPLSLHRTWITATGKADVQPPRKPLFGHSLAGGVIRLWPDDEVTHFLAVAEGIETALSLAWGADPAWALIDAGHLAKFEPMRGIEALVIGRDNDATGIQAAYACANAWAMAGVSVLVTNQAQNDLNDVMLEAA